MLFEVPFTSAMGDAQLSALGHLLDLWTHMDPKMHSDPNGPGVARLDHFSGLFLERAAGDDRWRLRARTWGNPTPGTVHGWHLVAAQAARQLDPDVTLPGPMAGAQDDSPGAAADRADGEGEGRARRRATGRA
ncbi:MAG TPA: hypothetical protein VFN65_14140 [Solirubrobacteraceae bacterium]|nr:hypothetical protein [Solirubrobacteraceae bacterium]